MTCACSPEDRTPPHRRDDDHVVALRGVHGDGVDLRRRPRRSGRADRGDLRDVRAGQIADDDVICAAEGAEIDALDVVQIHVTFAMLRRKGTRAPIGDDVDVLVDVRAEEQHRSTVLALDRVVAVAGIPLEHVVARAHVATSLPLSPKMKSLPFRRAACRRPGCRGSCHRRPRHRWSA